MSDAPVAVAKPPAAKPKKVTKKAAPMPHPPYNEMVKKAIVSLKDRQGSSRQAIIKYIKENFKVRDNADTHIKMCLKRLVEKKVLSQVKGSGASGSFKLAKVAEKPKAKPAASKPKKSAAPKKKPASTAAKAGAKKASTPKKTTKKPPAKKQSTKPKPKKAGEKKPAAKKASTKPKKVTTPKKAPKKQTKKPASKSTPKKASKSKKTAAKPKK